MSKTINNFGLETFLKLLNKHKYLSDLEVVEILKAGSEDPVRDLAHKKNIKESECCFEISKVLGIPFNPLDESCKKQIEDTLDRPEFIYIPLEVWRKKKVLPLKVGDWPLRLIMANPADVDTRSFFEFELGSAVSVEMSAGSKILEILDQREFLDKGLTDILEDNNSFEDSYSQKESNLKHEDISAPPIIRLVDRIFSDAISRRASDIHITPEKDKVNVKIRIDGLMEPLLDINNRLRSPVISRIKLLSGMDISERRKPQDGRLRIRGIQGNIDLRISVVPGVYGENVVIRILFSNQAKVSLNSLGLHKDEKDKILQTLKGSSKMVLVSGPTGSGKTSTLYACLRYLNDGKQTIVTVEDPIEYRIDGITQIQVNPKIDLTFAEGLRSILRQDPDIVMVGEIRDLETATIAMQAAQTGHLVLSTIHTNSAPASVVRLMDLGVPSYLIASSVSTIIAQRLVRKLCQRCKQEASSSEIKKHSLELGAVNRMYLPVGCPECRNSGYFGRTGILSILEITDSIRDAIRNNLGEDEIERRAINQGFRTLWETAKLHIENGETSYKEVQRVLGNEQHYEPILLSKEPHHSGIQKRKLLLVEDDESTRMVLSLLFRDQMFDVIEAEHGAEGLEKMYECLPDIVVCDLMMPKMSGLEMIQRVRNDSRLKQVPILMLTAAATEDNELSLIEKGADDFVSKTADSKIMLARVNRLLNRG